MYLDLKGLSCRKIHYHWISSSRRMWVEAADVSLDFLLHINDLWPSLCEINHTHTHTHTHIQFISGVLTCEPTNNNSLPHSSTLIKCAAASRHQRNKIRFHGSPDLKVTNTVCVCVCVCMCVGLTVSESVWESLLWHDLLLVLIVKWTEI